jgi:hypothetical protein
MWETLSVFGTSLLVKILQNNRHLKLIKLLLKVSRTLFILKFLFIGPRIVTN